MMFTEGLDENALHWVKQGSRGEKLDSPTNPLPEELTPSCVPDPFQKSHASASTCIANFSHVLPPLKFHSGLLTPHLVAPPDGFDEGEDVGDDDGESVASAPSCCANDGACVGVGDGPEMPSDYDYYNVDDMFSDMPRVGAKRVAASLNRGLLLENLRVDVPRATRRFTSDGETGIRSWGASGLNPGPATTNGHILRENVLLRNSNSSKLGLVGRDRPELGTPSAPPVMVAENGIEIESEQGRAFESSAETQRSIGSQSFSDEMAVSMDGEDVNMSMRSSKAPDDTRTAEGERQGVVDQSDAQVPNWQVNSLDNSPHYSVSGQYAWQTLIAYDACTRFCLFAWARGCQEAPEFLRDECLVLRNAFGLQRLLLQPKNAKNRDTSSTKNIDSFPKKGKKFVGKIRVEVKKIRIFPLRKLNTYSQRSALYLQSGAHYVKHISSLVKTGVTNFRLAPFTITSEEPLSCIFQLKSTLEDPQAETTTICLHPGESHVFFPESQGDTLLVELQDKKKSVLGQATQAVSSLAESSSERMRWWSIYDGDNGCIGKIQLSVGVSATSDDPHNVKILRQRSDLVFPIVGKPKMGGAVVETLAYDLVLDAAMRAQNFHSHNLRLHGLWKWLLIEFADYYEVSESYTKLRYLSQIMNVATPTKDCLELIYELLVPILKAKSEESLTRQEKGILLECENQLEILLASAFENYKSLDEMSETGFMNVFGSIPEAAAPALAPAVQVFTLLHDILTEDAQNRLRSYLQTAAKKRCQKHMLETDEFTSCNSENILVDEVTRSTAYLKMKNLCNNLSAEILADIKIHNQHILPSSIDLSNIGAAVYSVQLAKRITSFLAVWPPSSPLPYVNDLLKATADFERNLELWNISPVQGGLDSRSIFHNYILVWIQDMQLNLLELCKGEKVPWSGVMTNHFTSPFAEEMYNKMKNALLEYEVIINHWPQYSLILENAVADVERAIIRALEKQYNDILTPLKHGIPERLNMHVQKLTRRQSNSAYCVPSQLGIFLNTMKRILDVLHNKVEDMLKCWASCLPATGDKRSVFGEQMNAVTVLLKTKYKTYLQAIVGKLMNNMQANRCTRLKRILEEMTEEDGEPEIRERMQALRSQLIETASNLQEVFASQIFVSLCRGLWDTLGQIVLKFLEGRKENRVWYNGSYYVLVILDDTFASQMQRLIGNALQEKDMEPPRSVLEARSILCKDTANNTSSSTYYF